MKKQTEADIPALDNIAADACDDAEPALIEIYIAEPDNEILTELRAKIQQMNLPPSIRITTACHHHPEFVVEYSTQKPAADALAMLDKYVALSSNPLVKGAMRLIF